MDDRVRTDKLIKLIQRLREEIRYAQDQPIFIEFIVIDCDLEFEPGTTESLLSDAARNVDLEISQAGKESAMLRKPQVKGRMRRPILGGR